MKRSITSDLYKVYRQGYAQVAALQESRENVKCLEKGCDFVCTGNLMTHVKRIHKLTREQYLLKHKLPYDTKLYSSSHGEMMRAQNKRNYQKGQKKNEI